ncbi:hypothetical protein FMM68_00485 [Lachnospiraceae bacterium MD329]|nr:hypothetical protein [Lachnospiraceae bacterium MD329]
MKADVSVEEFLKDEKAHQIMLLSLKEILPVANNWFAFLISIIIAIISSVLIGFETNTVEHFSGMVGKCLDIELSILGCVLAVYSIMLAFFNKDFMKCLLKSKSGNKSVLKRYVSYYESILFLYFIGLCMTGIYMLVLSFIPSDFVLTDNNILNSILASVLIFVYISYTIRIFYEVKGLIYNTIMLFRASIAEQFME